MKDVIKCVRELPPVLIFEGILFTLEFTILQDGLVLGYMIDTISPGSPHYNDDPKEHKRWKRHSKDNLHDNLSYVDKIKSEEDLRYATFDLYQTVYMNNLDPNNPFVEEEYSFK